MTVSLVWLALPWRYGPHARYLWSTRTVILRDGRLEGNDEGTGGIHADVLGSNGKTGTQGRDPADFGTFTTSRDRPDVVQPHLPGDTGSGCDPKVIDRDLSEAREAGIDTLVCSWWGRQDPTDRAIRLLIERAPAHGLSVCIHWERLAPRPDKLAPHLRGKSTMNKAGRATLRLLLRLKNCLRLPN